VHYFLGILFISITVLADFPLVSERLSFKDQELSVAGTSTYLEKELYVIDEERWRVAETFKFFEIDDWAIKARFSAGYTGSGFMDGAIHGWHDFFNLPESGREGERKGRYQIRGFRTDGVPFELKNSGGFFEAPRVFIEKENLVFGVSIPLSTNNDSPSSPDIGIRYQRDWEQFSGGVGVIYYSDANVGEVLFKDFHFESDLKWNFEIYENLGGAFGGTISTPPYRKMGYVPTVISYLDFELNYKLHSGKVFFTVKENPGSGEMTSDVSFLVGYRRSS